MDLTYLDKTLLYLNYRFLNKITKFGKLISKHKRINIKVKITVYKKP